MDDDDRMLTVTPGMETGLAGSSRRRRRWQITPWPGLGLSHLQIVFILLLSLLRPAWQGKYLNGVKSTIVTLIAMKSVSFTEV